MRNSKFIALLTRNLNLFHTFARGHWDSSKEFSTNMQISAIGYFTFLSILTQAFSVFEVYSAFNILVQYK